MSNDLANALAFTAPQKAEILEVPIAPPGPQEVIVNAHYSLVSAGTERSFFNEPPHSPFIPGYSLTGEIVAVGDAVHNFKVGDLVVANAPHQSTACCDVRFVAAIPPGTDLRAASFFNVAAMAIHAFRLSNVRFGSGVLILGQGLIGLVATQIARFGGAAPLYVTDLDNARLQLALEFGADKAFHAADDTDLLEKELAALPGGGPTATIEITGNAQSIEKAIAYTRRGGTVVPGSLARDGFLTDMFGRAWLEGLTITGSYYNARPWMVSTTELSPPTSWPPMPTEGEERSDLIATGLGDLELFLRLLACGRFTLDPLISKYVTPQVAADMFDELVGPETLGAVIDWTKGR